MGKVKFIHCADIHLDSPMRGLRKLPENIFKTVQESTFQSFHELVNKGIENNIDFMIIAGDLFDQDNRSIRAQARLRKEMERLEKEGIHAFIVFGNHDYYSKSSISLHLPSNVHIFSEKVEVKEFTTKNKVCVHLYGFSYPRNHVYERMIDEFFKKEGADFHIGILHGQLEGKGEHSPYAPFRIEDLLKKGFDYWALGHIHKREILFHDPPIIYPGNTQGRHIKEKGPKGGYLVELSPSEANCQFIESSDCIWEERTIDGEKVKSFDDLYVLCEKAMEEIRREGKGIFVIFTIINFSLSCEITKNVIDEMIASLQEEEEEKASFVWPLEIKILRKRKWSREDLCAESDFYNELFSVNDSLDEMDDVLSPLYGHHLARKFLTPLTEMEMEQLKEEAANFLIEQLLNQEK